MPFSAGWIFTSGGRSPPTTNLLHPVRQLVFPVNPLHLRIGTPIYKTLLLTPRPVSYCSVKVKVPSSSGGRDLCRIPRRRREERWRVALELSSTKALSETNIFHPSGISRHEPMAAGEKGRGYWRWSCSHSLKIIPKKAFAPNCLGRFRQQEKIQQISIVRHNLFS